MTAEVDAVAEARAFALECYLSSQDGHTDQEERDYSEVLAALIAAVRAQVAETESELRRSLEIVANMLEDAEQRAEAAEGLVVALAEALETAVEFLPEGVNVVDCGKGTATTMPLPTMQAIAATARSVLADERLAALMARAK